MEKNPDKQVLETGGGGRDKIEKNKKKRSRKIIYIITKVKSRVESSLILVHKRTSVRLQNGHKKNENIFW